MDMNVLTYILFNISLIFNPGYALANASQAPMTPKVESTRVPSISKRLYVIQSAALGIIALLWIELTLLPQRMY